MYNNNNQYQQYPNQQQQYQQPPQYQQQYQQHPPQQNYQQYPQQNYYQPPAKSPQQIISKLQYSINYYKIDLGQLFQAYKQNFSATMQYHEFSALLLKIDPTLTPQEIQITFKHFDKDGDQTLSFQEFDSQLNDMKKKGEMMAKGEQTLKKLKYSIDYYNINMRELFAKYDTSKNNSIDKLEFTNLMQKIDPNIHPDDVDAAFIFMDSDQTGHINQQEFVEVLSQVQSGHTINRYQQAPQQQQYQQQGQYNQAPQQNYNQYPQQNYNQPPQQNYNQQNYNQPPQQNYSNSSYPQQNQYQQQNNQFQSMPPQQNQQYNYSNQSMR